MPSPYHWVTGGFDELGLPTLNSNVVTSLALPAGATLKKFVVRNTWVGLFTSGLDHTAVQPAYLSMGIQFTGGVYGGRSLYQQDRDIPFEANGFQAVAPLVYNCWHHASDEQLGLNQKCSYFIGSAGPATVDFTTALNFIGTPFQPPAGDWHMGYAILYRL